MAAAANSDGSGGGEKTIALISCDNKARFEVREAAALLSRTLRRMIDKAGADASGGGDGDGDGIRLPNVDAKTLAKVLEYCNKHATAGSISSAAERATLALDLERFDREFVRVDFCTLFSLLMAAHYLKIDRLKKLTSQTIADTAKGKTPEQIMKMSGVVLTPEEEDAVRRGGCLGL